MNARNSRRHLVVILMVLLLLTGTVATGIVLVDRKAARQLLEWLPLIAAAGIMVTTLTLAWLKRVPRDRGEGSGFARRLLRVNASTGLRTHGATDRGGWTYGSARDDNERRMTDR